MSFEATAIALHHSRSRGTAKLVLLGIANHDGDGGSWPSVKTLAKYAGVQPRNVQAALGKLEQLGEIRRHLNGGGSNATPIDQRPNLYEFLLRCPETCDRSKNHRNRTKLHLVDPLMLASPPDAGIATPLSESSPEPSPEPAIEIKRTGHSTREARCPEVRSGIHKRDVEGYCLHCGQLEQARA